MKVFNLKIESPKFPQGLPGTLPKGFPVGTVSRPGFFAKFHMWAQGPQGVLAQELPRASLGLLLRRRQFSTAQTVIWEFELFLFGLIFDFQSFKPAINSYFQT